MHTVRIVEPGNWRKYVQIRKVRKGSDGTKRERSNKVNQKSLQRIQGILEQKMVAILEMRLYIVYDQRAYSEEPSECTVMCTANSLKEARRDRNEMFPGCPIYSYNNTSKVLKDQKFEE